MAEMKYLTLYLDRKKEFDMLSDEQAGRLIKGLLEYGATGEELHSDDLTINILFSVIKAQLDEFANKYEEKCRKNKEIAKEREKNKRERKSTNVNERANSDTECNDTTNVNERDILCTESTNTNTKTNTNTINADALICGRYSHVKLTQQEKESLVSDYGTSTIEDYICRVDNYCERTGKEYPNCELTIREWLNKDKVEKSDIEKYNFVINKF